MEEQIIQYLSIYDITIWWCVEVGQWKIKEASSALHGDELFAGIGIDLDPISYRPFFPHE